VSPSDRRKSTLDQDYDYIVIVSVDAGTVDDTARLRKVVRSEHSRAKRLDKLGEMQGTWRNRRGGFRELWLDEQAGVLWDLKRERINPAGPKPRTDRS
jgi:hypothetical protein